MCLQYVQLFDVVYIVYVVVFVVCMHMFVLLRVVYTLGKL